MGHHKTGHRPPPPYRVPHAPQDGRGGYDGPQGHDPRGYGPPRRVPGIVILGGLVVWTLLAWGLWMAVDPLLGWVGGLVAPVLNVGKAVGGVAGLGNEVGALVDATGAQGMAQWLLGVLGWLARPAILVIWVLGAGAILLGRRLLSGGLMSRLLH